MSVVKQVVPERQAVELATFFEKGRSFPLGATLVPGGVNFCVYSRSALHIILNAYWGPLDFELPVVTNGGETWRRWVDTALEPPHEIVEWSSAPPVHDRTYHAEARSVVVLIAGVGFKDAIPAELVST